jgi:glutamyl-tRNA reductase
MQVGVIGINHKQAAVSLREVIAKACQKRFFLNNILKDVGGIVLLSTCNRCELYFNGPDLAEIHQMILAILREEISEEFEQKCYSFFGNDCFLHLAKVTVGLDSAVPLETEIQGQVKTAYENAASLGGIPHELHFLFQKCLSLGKEIRTKCPITKTVPDLEHAILLLAKQFFEIPACPLFIGTSEINIKIARFLKQKGIQNMTFCNRTIQRADIFAEEFDGNVLPWDELQERWIEFDWVISAAKSQGHILTSQSQLDSSKKKLLIDLAVPRNISPSLAGGCVELFNIDTLQKLLEERKATLQNATRDAETFLLQACERKIASFHEKSALQLAK